MQEEIAIESLKLNVHIPNFSMRSINIPKLSRVLRRKGYDIDVIREGQRIDIPIPASKEGSIILLDPLERWISLDAKTLRDAVEA